MIQITHHMQKNDMVRFMVRGKLRAGRVEKVETAKTGNEVVTLETSEGFRAFKAHDISDILNETVGTIS